MCELRKHTGLPAIPPAPRRSGWKPDTTYVGYCHIRANSGSRRSHLETFHTPDAYIVPA
jgi:hypothetical protein